MLPKALHSEKDMMTQSPEYDRLSEAVWLPPVGSEWTRMLLGWIRFVTAPGP
jgi:hypothetical protein